MAKPERKTATATGCTHATADQDCPCWREGVRATHNRIGTQVSSDQKHPVSCQCPDCDTIETVLLATVYEAAHDSYLDEYRKRTGWPGRKLWRPKHRTFA